MSFISLRQLLDHAITAARAAARGVCKARFEAFGCAGQAAKLHPLPLEAMVTRYQ
jgi:fructose-bisphosphate aldolase class II